MSSVRLAIILLYLGLAIPAHAVTLFSENYEVNAVGDLAAKGWGITQYCVGYCSLDIVPAPAGRTGRVLRMEYRGPQVDDSHNAKIGRGFAPAPEIYGRYYRRTDPVPPATQSSYHSATSKQHYLKTDGSTSDGTPNGYTTMWFGGRTLSFASQSPNSNDYPNVAGINMLDGRWYCVEYHWKMNTPGVANGVQEMWIDGAQTVGYYNKSWRDSAHANAAFTVIEVYRQGSTDMYRYEDDFVLATTRVGCSGGPPPSDTTPPAAPVGLSVR